MIDRKDGALGVTIIDDLLMMVPEAEGLIEGSGVRHEGASDFGLSRFRWVSIRWWVFKGEEENAWCVELAIFCTGQKGLHAPQVAWVDTGVMARKRMDGPEEG